VLRSSKIFGKCKNIKLLITDVDGVLTDGSMYYSDKGEMLKKFNTRDGMAVELLSKNGIKTVFMTKENSKIVLKRAKKVKATAAYVGVKKKELELPRICKRFQITTKNIAYIGDDIIDLEIMKRVGFSATPKDGMELVKKACNYVCRSKGGEGAFREISDLIISIRNM